MSTPSTSVKVARIFALLVVGGGLVFIARSLVSAISDAGPTSVSPAAILEAASTGDVAALERELKAGAEKDARQFAVPREAGMTPLMYAARSGNMPGVTMLVGKSAQVNLAANDGRTALMFAALGDEPMVVKHLLEAKANPNSRDVDGWTALMLASIRGKAETVRLLTASGADVNGRNKYRQTSLILAARSSDPEKVKALLAAGASVEDYDLEGKTALHNAVEAADNSLVIAALLNAGANVNAVDADGMTPLMRAAERGNADIVRVLLEKKASLEIKDKRGWDAKQWAENRGDDYGKQIVELIKNGAAKN